MLGYVSYGSSLLFNWAAASAPTSDMPLSMILGKQFATPRTDMEEPTNNVAAGIFLS
jgi:hypothetical protein